MRLTSDAQLARDERLAKPRQISTPEHGFLGYVTRHTPIDAPVWWEITNRKGRSFGTERTLKRAIAFLEYSAKWTPGALDLEEGSS